ncbi:MAG: lysophospholipid acyltransferase family protein [Gemmatimonadaceae bacterium]|nr:lysophospholipid acyltransferase family protein [Chitinophagaceae bacterium]
MYYIIFPILYTISLLPLRVLYLLSDFVTFILYNIVGYRKEVVMQNLTNAFPLKTEEEKKKIAKQFYRNFCDNWLEALKMMSISEKEMKRRFTHDLSVLAEIHKTGKCCHILLGHQFNWEWANAVVPMYVPFKVLTAYSPISNKALDRLFLYLRQRLGPIMLPFNDMAKAMLPHRHTQYILALVADQSPSNPMKSFWLNFLGKPTAFVQGPEKGARLGNIPVTFMAFSKPKRGHYHLQSILIDENPGSGKPGDVTRKYVELLESNILANPAIYLWSHKRWKLKWKDEYKRLWIDVSPPPNNA